MNTSLGNFTVPRDGHFISIGQRLAQRVVGGASILYSSQRFSQWLLQGNVGISTFGKDLLGAVSTIRPHALEKLAQAKGRAEDKPFVIITSRKHIDALLSLPGIAKEVNSHTKELIKELLYKGSLQHPLGIMLPRNPQADLPKRLCGFLEVDGTRIPTIGAMVAGEDKEFEELIDNLSEVNYLLAGTSANLSHIGKNGKETRARGSGHHRIAGAIVDFGWNSNVAIFVPDESPKHARHKRIGPSTSIIFLSSKGDKAYLVREGSFKQSELAQLLQKVGVKIFEPIKPDIHRIAPYDYPHGLKDIFRNHGYRHISLIHNFIDYMIYKAKRNKEFRIPFFIKHILPKPL